MEEPRFSEIMQVKKLDRLVRAIETLVYVAIIYTIIFFFIFLLWALVPRLVP